MLNCRRSLLPSSTDRRRLPIDSSVAFTCSRCRSPSCDRRGAPDCVRRGTIGAEDDCRARGASPSATLSSEEPLGAVDANRNSSASSSSVVPVPFGTRSTSPNTVPSVAAERGEVLIWSRGVWKRSGELRSAQRGGGPVPGDPPGAAAERLKRGSYGQESTLKKIVPENEEEGRRKEEGRRQRTVLLFTRASIPTQAHSMARFTLIPFSVRRVLTHHRRLFVHSKYTSM